jgi:hypothetical protein
MKQRQIEVLDFLLDDHFALWDFADTFPALRPGVSNGGYGELSELVQERYVLLTLGKWSENQTEAVRPEDAERLLRDPANWQRTGNDPGYVLELTELGRHHLRSLGIGLPER